MKNIALVSLLIIVIFSCSKTDKYTPIDCSNYLDIQPQIVCPGTVCQSDTCTAYFGIWKGLFLSKNQMTEKYFDDHITICNSATYKYANQGIQFELAYKLKIDWFETKFEEGFMIYLLPSYLVNNPTINLPANSLLSGDQIGANINNSFFGYAIHKISPIDRLRYSSRQEAVEVIAHAAGVDDMCSSTIYVQYEDIDNPVLGHPVLAASGALNWNENKCVSGIMDLSTDYFQADKNPCAIYFCFARGTKITQNNNQTRSLEKLNNGDTILSLNRKTMKIESDIIEHIDSVVHSDIIMISFNDLTENRNTTDHPYWVKNKGWSSYKPSETLQKYNLKTKQLQIGDTCLKFKDNSLTEVLIKNISENPGKIITYNIGRLKRNKSYFANGILVSNEDN
jgi:hypothetical protein